jgi:hypothetical protein
MQPTVEMGARVCSLRRCCVFNVPVRRSLRSSCLTCARCARGSIEHHHPWPILLSATPPSLLLPPPVCSPPTLVPDHALLQGSPHALELVDQAVAAALERQGSGHAVASLDEKVKECGRLIVRMGTELMEETKRRQVRPRGGPKLTIPEPTTLTLTLNPPRQINSVRSPSLLATFRALTIPGP